MKKFKRIAIFTIFFLLLLFSRYFFSQSKKSEIQLAVIPHFMIAPQKVENFYKFLMQEYNLTIQTPDRIILLSPNHFFPKQKSVVWICKIQNIRFKNENIIAHPLWDKQIHCWDGEWYKKWNQIYVKDHWIGEHFQQINYFFKDQKIIPLLLPTHELNNSEWLAKKIAKLPGKTLVIASVDFSHYQSESIAIKEDQISFNTLKEKDKFEQIRNLDVDCPSCLWVVYLLAQSNNLQVQQRLRDSSSSILGRDLMEENTSRQFLWWK